jgi:hypothetical protein
VKPYVIRRLRVRTLLGRLPFLAIFGFVAIVVIDVSAFFLAVAVAVILYGLWTDSLLLIDRTRLQQTAADYGNVPLRPA